MGHYKIAYTVQHPFLKDFIIDYWVCGFHKSLNDSIAFDVGPPSGYPIIHFLIDGKSFSYNEKKQSYQIAVMGQLLSHFALCRQPEVKVLCINFKPYGLYNLYGIPTNVLTNTIICGTNIFEKNKINELYKKLSSVTNHEEIIQLIEHFLWDNRKKNIRFRLYFDSLVDEIHCREGIVDDIRLLLPKQFCARTFQLYFNEVVGCSPKHFSRILRHKCLLKSMFQNPNFEWKSLVSEGMFYDFSHFSRDFQLFSGCPPHEYLKKENELARQIVI